LKKLSLILLLLSYFLDEVHAQKGDKNQQALKYTHTQLVDSTEGMLIYKKMMQVLKLDFELLSEQGSDIQGWNEEYFDNGQLQRISYYKEGKLVLFKNFYENGQCEHNITYTDTQNCNIDVYYENGGLKNQLHFINGQPEKMTEFFANGLPKSQLEFDVEKGCLSSKRSWFLNAELQFELVVTDVQNKTYLDKAFYPNGLIKEEGSLVYFTENKEYIKVGAWHTFESNGKKKKSEKFKLHLGSN
jgi:antitoxin component YwqK of YwqJK toxin-antitoxin module